MDLEASVKILIVFTVFQHKLLMNLNLLMNDHKRLQQKLYSTRHRIRHLACFHMIHGSDIVCRRTARMGRRCFVILCHLLWTAAWLASTEIVDVEKMVAMFLHVIMHNVKNRVMQRKFVRSSETILRHFNLVLLAVSWPNDLRVPKGNYKDIVSATNI